MSKYTRADFETARFAKHHNGSVASRRSGLLWPSPWLTAASESHSDSNMADNGWFPVPEHVPGQTITESEWVTATWGLDANMALGFKLGLNFAGITVAPDPEPTNAEKLERIHQLWAQDIDGLGLTLGEWMSKRGVKAPEADDE